MIRLPLLLMVCAFMIVYAVIGYAAPTVPTPPTTVWGVLTVDGQLAPDGTTLRALIEGTEYASTAVFSANGQSGLYVIDVPADDPNTAGVIEGGQVGQTIAFAMDERKVEQTSLWKMGSVVNLDLIGNTTTSPVANFVCGPRDGLVPLTIHCTDTSTGSPNSWLWIFGDDTNSTLQNPTHTYSSTGSYKIELIVSSPNGNDKLARLNYTLVYTLTPTETPSTIPTLTSTPNKRNYLPMIYGTQ